MLQSINLTGKYPVPKTSTFLFLEQLFKNWPILIIFGMLNTETIWHEHLTDLFTSSVRRSHFTLRNPSHFSTLLFTYFRLFPLAQKKTSSNCVLQLQLFTYCCHHNGFFSEPPTTTHNWLISEPKTSERMQQTFSQMNKFCNSQVSVMTFSGGQVDYRFSCEIT